jgi:hypothetical protein
VRTTVLSAVTVGLLVMAGAAAQSSGEETTYGDVQYVSGKQGLSEGVKGQLLIAEQQIAFKQNDGMTAFAIPMTTVRGVSNRVETNPGSIGRKALLGVFASHREEFLTVTVQGINGLEAVVFKVGKNTSDGMVARIQLYQRRAVIH